MKNCTALALFLFGLTSLPALAMTPPSQNWTPGSAWATREERIEYHNKMQAAKTKAERDKLTEEQREKSKDRSRDWERKSPLEGPFIPR